MKKGKKHVKEKATDIKSPVLASFFIHAGLIAILFVPWSSLQKTEMPPVINVHVVEFEKSHVKRKPVTIKREDKSIHHKVTTRKVERKQSVSSDRPKKKNSDDERKKLLAKKQAEERLLRQKEAKKTREIQRLAAIKKLEKQKAQQKKQAEEKQKLKKLAVRQLEAMRASELAERKARATREQQQVAEYVEKIRQAISSQWYYPPSASRNMRSVVKMVLAPTGELLSLSTIQSSGSDAFDQSVLQAIKMSTPFAFLQQLNIGIFESHFRAITLTFTPEELME